MAGAVSSAAGKVASTAQAMSDQTTKSTFNSLLIWEGQTPPTFNLVVDLMATIDAKVEVNDAISTLMQMESPELAAMAATGRRPTPVILDIGRKLKLMDVVIQNVSFCSMFRKLTRVTIRTIQSHCSALVWLYKTSLTFPTCLSDPFVNHRLLILPQCNFGTATVSTEGYLCLDFPTPKPIWAFSKTP